jgi:hypothetical protein
VENPFELDGEWFRCSLHAHTTESDGQMPPSMLVRHYEWAGFDVLAITDHALRTEHPSTDRLLVIPSTELDARLAGRDNAHLLGLGVSAAPGKPRAPLGSIAEAVAFITEHDGVPYLAHPYWTGLRTVEFEACEGLLGLEVYNTGCELECGRGLSAVHWDEALDAGRLLYAIATDDCHYPGFDSSYAWTWVRAPVRTAEAVLEALRLGRAYSSTGPEIHSLTVSDGFVEVRCSAARSVTLLTGRTRGTTVHSGRLGYRYGGDALERADDGSITAARLQVPNRAPYGRLEVAGAHGGTAWTNPLWGP